MIEPLVYPGSVEDFRGFMLNLETSLRQKAHEWDEHGIKVYFGHHDIIGLVTAHYNFERSSIWQYEIYEFSLSPIGMSDEPIGSALIVAIQVRPDETALSFYDGLGFFENGNINPRILAENFYLKESGLSFGESWPENTYLSLPKPDGMKLFQFAPAGQSFQDYIDLIKQETEPSDLTARRGPRATPEERKEAILKKWLESKDKMTVEAFCKREGVASSTFRLWRRQKELSAN